MGLLWIAVTVHLGGEEVDRRNLKLLIPYKKELFECCGSNADHTVYIYTNLQNQID